MATFRKAVWILAVALLPAAGFCPPNTVPCAVHRHDHSSIGQTSAAQQQGFAIRVNVDFVMVDAVVRTGRAGYVGDLAMQDFVIYDNGVAQEVTHFSRDQLPLAVALVLDSSPSIAPYLEPLRSAAMSALLHLKPQDQVVLFSFDSSVYRHGDLTRSHFLIAQQISRMAIRPGTNIYDALFGAARYLRRSSPGHRRAIILVSDNVQSVRSAYSPSHALQEVLEAGATLFSVRTRGDNPSGMISMRASGDWMPVEQIALQAGGEVLNVGNPESLSKALDAAISDLRMRYVLGFNPSDPGKDGSFHRLSVRLASKEKCPDCRVQARSGYYSGAQGSLPISESEPARPETGDKGEDLARNRILVALASELELNDLPFRISAVKEVSDVSGAAVRVNLNIDPAKVGFKMIEGRHVAKLRVAVYYSDPKGRILGDIWYKMDVNLTEDVFRQIMASGIPFSQLVPLKMEEQVVKVIVYDHSSDKIGSRLTRLR